MFVHVVESALKSEGLVLNDVVLLLWCLVVFVNSVECCLDFCWCRVFVVAVMVKAYFTNVVVVVVVVVVVIDGEAACGRRKRRRRAIRRMAMDRRRV